MIGYEYRNFGITFNGVVNLGPICIEVSFYSGNFTNLIGATNFALNGEN